ncbi:hypothetical protein M758_2G011900 [Ceratodon purpureus]|nr:hypothetical protein M758_2G011900 [Ceratodon purpureus]
MKKKTTWAASVVKKQLQTCCKHQTFSLETTERDDTSQGFRSPSRVIHISSPIKEGSNPVLLRRKSFNVSHARSLLTTPEPLTPFRKSVESAIPLCRSSTFKSGRLQNVKSSSDLAGGTPEELAPMQAPSKGKVLHKSGPLPVLQQLFRGSLQGGIISSPLNMKKQLSGPLMSVPRKPLSGAPSPKQSVLGGPSPLRLSKVKFSPTPHEIAASRKLSDMIAEEEPLKVKQIVPPKAKKQLAPLLDKKGSRESNRISKSDCHSIASSPAAKSMEPPTEAVAIELEHLGEDEARCVGPCGNSNVREGNVEKSDAVDYLEKDHNAAAVKIQAAYRGHRTRNKLASELRGSCSNPSEDTTEEEVDEAPSISTQMSRTDPQKQRRNPPPRVNRGWNGSMRSAQDHQALLRSRQEAALKRERAMEYALSRQRWRTGSKAAKGPIWCTDDRLPDKPGWVRNWLERATRMSAAQNSQIRVFETEFEQNDPQSESLSMKSTVGMCTTDIGSAEVNLGWPLSLRQQHAAGLLQPKTPTPEPPELQIETPTPPKQSKRSNYMNGGVHPHQHLKSTEFSTSTADSGDLSSTIELLSPTNEAHEIESSGRPHRHNTDLESVGSCEGPDPTLHKLLSPVAATKPRLQHKLSNSNSLKEAAKRDRLLALRPQSQVSVALSDGNSADTTAASVQRPLWR